ncbi:MAG: dihydrolipoyl dehydrogenase [Thermaerobacter sp.]|nr:dihydrolipoyl dehydrogenase [Bacillota bacterium]REJ37780.1 MAG: dihydrolipoyl dehydrogenase [Bacillota bacterium]
MVVGDIATGVDVVVIGGGPGGYVAAIRAAQLGKEVLLVEREALGGVCLNVGCIPSKALISVASLYHRLQEEAERGLMVSGARVDLNKLQAWKQGVVDRLTGGVGQLLKGNDVQVTMGTATFTGPNQIIVETAGGGAEHYKFDHAIIATGSRPVELPAFPFDGRRILSSTDALALTELPGHLLVIGGGYIGLELGTVYAKLGSRVTVVEAADRLLPGTDPELVQVVARRLRRLGVEVHVNTLAQGFEDDGRVAKVRLSRRGDGGQEETFTVDADRVLVCVGRRPNSEGLGLDRAGVRVDDRGFIPVDQQMRTSAPHIFAIGDVVGGAMLAHKASHEGIVAAEVIAGEPAAFEPAAIPAVIFTDPEIASVGLTETQAEAQGYQVMVGRFPFAASGRALTTGESEGFVKVVADASSHVVLGVHIVGHGASDLIGEGALAVEMAARLEDLALTIHPHPTLPESIMEAAEAALGQPIHVLPPRRR